MQHKIAHTGHQTLGKLEVKKLKTLNYTYIAIIFTMLIIIRISKCWTSIKIEIT